MSYRDHPDHDSHRKPTIIAQYLRKDGGYAEHYVRDEIRAALNRIATQAVAAGARETREDLLLAMWQEVRVMVGNSLDEEEE